MFNEWKKYLIWVGITVAGIIMLNNLKDFYIYVGRTEVETEYNNKIEQLQTAHEEQSKQQNTLLEKAVEEKLDERKEHRKELRKRDMTFAQYKDKVKLEFDDIKINLTSMEMENYNLRVGLLNTKSMLISFSLANKNLSSTLQEMERRMVLKYDMILSATIAIIEEKYISFQQKIDKVKNSVKSKRKFFRRWE